MMDVKRTVNRFKHNRAAKTLKNAAVSEDKAKTALVLGGGAPNAALMAGGLAAFEDTGVAFDVVSTTGAGALIGLLWLSPKNATPRQALEMCVNSYVSDPIYACFPVNYKVFFKPGLLADAWRRMLAATPAWRIITEQSGQTPSQRVFSDWAQLAAAALSPSGLTPWSAGLCARTPWAEDLIDFDAVRSLAPHFYINAYNVTDQAIEDFGKNDITLEHFKAALAFPFIYGPYEMNGKTYYEGAVVDCLNVKDLTEKHTGLETIVVFDVMAAEDIIRSPRDLYESWVLSMMIPLVSVAKDDLELFQLKYNKGWRRKDGAKADLLVVPFDVPPEHEEEALDWSYSNGRRLFDIGYKMVMDVLASEEGSVLLPSRAKPKPSPRRKAASGRR